MVLIKAGSILIANNLDNIKLSARNQLSGIISHIERGSVNSIVDLDLGDGLALSAGITMKSSDLLNLVPGQKSNGNLQSRRRYFGRYWHNPNRPIPKGRLKLQVSDDLFIICRMPLSDRAGYF